MYIQCTLKHALSLKCVLIIIYFQVSVDGEMVKSVDLFDEGLTLTELKVIKIIH